MSLDVGGIFVCIEPGYHAPQAAPPPDDDDDLAPPVPEPDTFPTGLKRQRRKRAIVKIADRHLGGLVEVLRALGRATTSDLAMAYHPKKTSRRSGGAHVLAHSTVLVAMHWLEDAGRVRRVGVAPLLGGAIVWRVR